MRSERFVWNNYCPRHPKIANTRHMQDSKNEPNTGTAAETIRIDVSEKGPYLVYGQPPLAVQYILPDANGESWYFQEGQRFATDCEPTALCRCGSSKRHPYCDGSHATAAWNPQLTAPTQTAPSDLKITEGATIELLDRPKLCVFARFCHPQGDAWTLTEQSEKPEARELAIREASMCPSGRLTARDRRTSKAFELHFDPSLGLLEDSSLGCSGGLWVRGGIPVRQASGTVYEIRNRIVLCRCGQSANKPFCDGTHATVKWHDHIESVPTGETVPEKVY